MIVRRSARHEIVLPLRFRLAETDRRVFRHSPTALTPDGWVEGCLVDFSADGLGLVSEVFTPRRSTIDIRVFGLGSNAEVDEPVLALSVKVQRVVMVDRRPGYLIGAAFSGLSAAERATVASLSDLLEGTAA